MTLTEAADRLRMDVPALRARLGQLGVDHAGHGAEWRARFDRVVKQFEEEAKRGS